MLDISHLFTMYLRTTIAAARSRISGHKSLQKVFHENDGSGSLFKEVSFLKRRVFLGLYSHLTILFGIKTLAAKPAAQKLANIEKGLSLRFADCVLTNLNFIFLVRD